MALVLLIDGHSQAYRAYFGMKTPLSTREGEPTAAVYGFARKLLATLREVKPDYVAVAFDTGDTWRHAEFPEYKATRDAMPDDMRTQMTRIEAMLRAFNIPILTYTNYEADDILGTRVYDANSAWVGEVSAFLPAPEAPEPRVVIDIGGFLGFGETPVEIEAGEITVAWTADGDVAFATVELTEAELELMARSQG